VPLWNEARWKRMASSPLLARMTRCSVRHGFAPWGMIPASRGLSTSSRHRSSSARRLT
jgi:hypothetical protein